MWETVKQILLSQHYLSGAFYFVAGAVVGIVVTFFGNWYNFKAQRPRLIASGGGSGGNDQEQRWTITISNRPAFLGQNVDGESARDVSVLIRPEDSGSEEFYSILWDSQPPERRATIEPGQDRSLTLFRWNKHSEGYFIVDDSGEPVARFQGHELRFLLRLNDRLGRTTDFPFTVKFDDTHLKQRPRLQIVHPLTFSMRLFRAKNGLRQISSAFRSR
jgi:hypothetical protein